MTPKLKCLTLYAGAGGADLGLLAAGVEHVACVDANADCVATLRAAGLPGIRAGIGGPYEDAPAFDLSPFVGVDLVWASPPCQPYSRAGKGLGADDARDGWPHTLAILATLRPRWAVVENVRGAPVETWAGELRAVSLASQDGTMADWLTARAVARPLCEAVTAVENRIRAAGFYGDTAVEMAVLGRLGRRHTDSRSVTYSELR